MKGSISYQIYKGALLLSSLLSSVSAQGAGTLTPENHPSLSWSKCSAGGSCSAVSGSVVIDANWRWVHDKSGTNCYTGNTWDATLCPDDKTCAANCAVDGANYASTYGVTTSGDSLRINFVTNGGQKNIGSRLYLLENDTTYEKFNLLNQEFTFDVDVSHLPCGLNGALYFVDMDADGGMAKYPTNKAGAKYGTGYCDSQCPRDLKFINGEANVEGWTPSTNDPNSGIGDHGTCCAEMDIWEANSISEALTPHPCDTPGQTMCSGNSCGGTYSTDRYGGTCDPDGCDFNPYRQGATGFYGAGKTVDTTAPFTVVTQFLTSDGTSSGTLNEIKRFYVQNGKVIGQPQSTVAGVTGNTITDSYCKAQKAAFGDTDEFTKHGALAGMGAAFEEGMVLVMSLWDDHNSNMLWLDSTYPTDSTALGAKRGTCDISSGSPDVVESQDANSYVVFSNIKTGPIGSTFNSGSTGGNGGSSTTTTTKAPVTTTTRTTTTSQPTTTAGSGSGGSGAAHYAQCGGIGYSGPTTCVSPYTCTKQNDYYSQCL
ncbi:Exoglucanase 1 [Penicillium diatomitis]|uniref:Glucanase n=1 Tax=Penicillium diatomitis TaxID=2819901 RepID=A0A9W9XBX2_9EURO|nr:Exoglucanase 1 [Penicillium diatomitis]KAJ5488550.1 Exoglucanase 1 [Penicillium diatomitis]